MAHKRDKCEIHWYLGKLQPEPQKPTERHKINGLIDNWAMTHQVYEPPIKPSCEND